MATRAGTTRTFTISFPPKLAEQVELMAANESRTTSELFREAFRIYRAQRALAMLEEFHAMAEAKGHNGYGPDDVDRLVHEVRAEMTAENAKKTAA